MIWLNSLFSRLSGYFWAGLAVLAAVLVVLKRTYQRGREDQEAKQKEQDYEELKLRADVREDVDAKSNADVLDELREHIKRRDSS